MIASADIDLELRVTEDGSHTLNAVTLGECYHSTHGAIQESMHIFINEGLLKLNKKQITVFEVGFGTGLNALLTLLEAEKKQFEINYISIEKYPVSVQHALQLNYPEKIAPEKKTLFGLMHYWQWDQPVLLQSGFVLEKIAADFTTYTHKAKYDLVYYDAFSPEKQPEMWTAKLFEQIYNNCNSGAILTTYCAKGAVKRNLLSAGFSVEKVPGPPGKREFLRAIKL